jgi:peptidoglycan/LPS O-acetylase OafA/YrhL
VTGVAAEAAAHERSAGVHFPCLDSYRGIGMTMVLCNHAAYATGFIQNSSLGPVVARFDLSVPMFFVMSGFLLFRPYARSVLEDRPLPSLGTFYRRRALRILPSYWLALAGVGLVFGLQIATVQGWVGNVLLLPAVGVPVEVCQAERCHVAYGITQAWSIGVEATYYLLLPLFATVVAARLARSDATRRLQGLLMACAGLYAAGALFRVAVVATDPSWARQSLLWLPMFLDLFAIGMALAVLSAAPAGSRARDLLDRAANHPGLCWAMAGALFLVMTRFSPPTEPFGLNGREYVPRQLVYGVASAAWLLPAMFGDQSAGRLRRVLASRPLVYLGAVSLGFYLWHLALVEQAKAWTIDDYAARQALAANPDPSNPLGGLETFTGNFALVAAIAWICSFAVASVLHYAVERPAMRLKEGRT